jgi:argininosuccinate lyase
MDKMWAGRFTGTLDKTADDFNSSLRVDCRMFRQDIRGSMAHAAMLGKRGIISVEDAERIMETLGAIAEDLESGALDFSAGGEDIHMFVEAELTRRIGEVGKRLHTARSRNDQVALDVRLYLRDEGMRLIGELKQLLDVLADLAEEHAETIMPGYTHLQRAQPITLGHHLMAYAMMFVRDIERIIDALTRMNESPLGSCALAGTTYPTDRGAVAELLGFDGVTKNSLDGVSDRDFCLELSSMASILMMHLSRFSEELILWSSWEFRFIELDDAYSTGSSIMPQKKNPDMADLIRGKTGRVYGDMMTLFTMMKGLPLAYNKDMQEDKEAIFDSLDTVFACLSVFTPMLKTMRVRPDVMRHAAAAGFINATDVADYLVREGMPFRSAYKITGQLVARCIADGCELESLPLSVYREYSELFSEDLFDEISLESCVAKRTSEGGTSPDSVRAQVAYIRGFLKDA